MDLVTGLTIFVLAVFIGFEIITKVPPTLHTPLMSGSNAISGITLVGAILVGEGQLAAWLAFAAIVLATINVVLGAFIAFRQPKLRDCTFACESHDIEGNSRPSTLASRERAIG